MVGVSDTTAMHICWRHPAVKYTHETFPIDLLQLSKWTVVSLRVINNHVKSAADAGAVNVVNTETE